MKVFEPNYTQTPNVILDGMASLSEPELRVSLTICRQTFGWHREAAVMSISFLMKATGLCNRAVITACESLCKSGMIEKQATKQHRGANSFKMIVNDLLPTFTGKASDLLPTFTSTCEPGSQVPVNDVHTNKETSKQRRKKGSAADAASADSTPEIEKENAGVAGFPGALGSANFLAAWGEWKKFRRETRKPLTSMTVKMQLKKLEAFGEAGAIASIEQSIEHGWQGLFPPKNGCGRAVTSISAVLKAKIEKLRDEYDSDDRKREGMMILQEMSELRKQLR